MVTSEYKACHLIKLPGILVRASGRLKAFHGFLPLRTRFPMDLYGCLHPKCPSCRPCRGASFDSIERLAASPSGPEPGLSNQLREYSVGFICKEDPGAKMDAENQSRTQKSCFTYRRSWCVTKKADAAISRITNTCSCTSTFTTSKFRPFASLSYPLPLQKMMRVCNPSQLNRLHHEHS